jgi:hypothetical protein
MISTGWGCKMHTKHVCEPYTRYMVYYIPDIPSLLKFHSIQVFQELLGSKQPIMVTFGLLPHDSQEAEHPPSARGSGTTTAPSRHRRHRRGQPPPTGQGSGRCKRARIVPALLDRPRHARLVCLCTAESGRGRTGRTRGVIAAPSVGPASGRPGARLVHYLAKRVRAAQAGHRTHFVNAGRPGGSIGWTAAAEYPDGRAQSGSFAKTDHRARNWAH